MISDDEQPMPESFLKAGDDAAAAVAVAPRVALADIENAIAARFDETAFALLTLTDETFVAADASTNKIAEALGVLSVCFLVLRNGWTVIGKSAPASPENFNRDLGKKLAYDDAIRQLWPLMGFALKERLGHK